MDIKQTVARIKFPLWHFRSWLCDKGWVPCHDCYQNRETDSVKLGEIADILWEIKGHNAFPNFVAVPIKNMIDQMDEVLHR